MQTNFCGYRLLNITILTIAIFSLAGTANAQEEKPADNAVAQANNPLGLGFGRVLPSKKAVFNVFLEPQFSVADKGAGWPVWQLFFAVNTQLK